MDPLQSIRGMRAKLVKFWLLWIGAKDNPIERRRLQQCLRTHTEF